MMQMGCLPIGWGVELSFSGLLTWVSWTCCLSWRIIRCSAEEAVGLSWMRSPCSAKIGSEGYTKYWSGCTIGLFLRLVNIVVFCRLQSTVILLFNIYALLQLNFSSQSLLPYWDICDSGERKALNGKWDQILAQNTFILLSNISTFVGVETGT